MTDARLAGLDLDLRVALDPRFFDPFPVDEKLDLRQLPAALERIFQRSGDGGSLDGAFHPLGGFVGGGVGGAREVHRQRDRTDQRGQQAQTDSFEFHIRAPIRMQCQEKHRTPRDV